MAQRDGVGENREQLMISTSTSRGFKFAFFNACSTTSKMTVSASFRLAAIDRSALEPSFCKLLTMPGGQAVAGPVPDRSKMR
eukprot:CAMPEP_0113473128 /NCGR_PEP_ID=MMETSP0014_2-20120614/17880_1 /TAXON_ID=2857 /ORGANISM="Nitzschia sp." /LENGTH=81 /DNA_ID=CAMNT_0000365877 /DNA_START=136 /DNA_END=378 /DNA_ORIENTATION=+ /assembly_acc=CAM_ASM_000159